MIVVADRLVAEWIFHDEPITTQDVAAFLQTNESVNINLRCYDFLCDWVAANSSKFSVHGPETYGVLEGGWAYIIRGVFNHALDDEGFNVKGFLVWAKRKRLIDVRDKGYTKTKRIGGVATECVVLMLPIEQEEVPF